MRPAVGFPPRTITRALLCATLLANACKEAPSFSVRWQLQGRPDPITGVVPKPAGVTNAYQCTSLGITAIRIAAYDAEGVLADEAIAPCFAEGEVDANSSVDGGHLRAGVYGIEVRGVQSDQRPWVDAAVQADLLARFPDYLDEDLLHRHETCKGGVREPTCRPEALTCDCAPLLARNDHTELLAPFVLVGPPECIDGIDNDRDGVADLQDEACKIDLANREADTIGSVQFRIDLSLFGGNRAVACLDAGLDALLARACPIAPGQVLETCPDDAVVLGGHLLSCSTTEPVFFADTLDQGEYLYEVLGVADNEVITRPVAERTQLTGFVRREIQLNADDFLAPIVAPTAFTLELLDGIGDSARQCDADAGTGREAIAELRVELRDAHGARLSQTHVLGPGTDEVDQQSLQGRPLDGTPLPCTAGRLVTEPLTWGGFSVRVETRLADGTVCHSTDASDPPGPLLVGPGNALQVDGLKIAPVLVDGKPPQGC